MERVAVDVYVPRFTLDLDTFKFESGKDVTVTLDREDDEIVILDFGGDIGEVYFNRDQLAHALTILNYGKAEW